MRNLYVVVEDVEGGIEAEYLFNTYEEARKYLEEIIEERGDLVEDLDDAIVMENDDAYYIRKASLKNSTNETSENVEYLISKLKEIILKSEEEGIDNYNIIKKIKKDTKKLKKKIKKFNCDYSIEHLFEASGIILNLYNYAEELDEDGLFKLSEDIKTILKEINSFVIVVMIKKMKARKI